MNSDLFIQIGNGGVYAESIHGVGVSGHDGFATISGQEFHVYWNAGRFHLFDNEYMRFDRLNHPRDSHEIVENY